MVSEQSILDNMEDGHTKLELILKESDKKWEKDLARVERKLDDALEEIKSLINGITLQHNEIRNQMANQGGVHRGSILGKPTGVQDKQKLISRLQEKDKLVDAKWTTERCTICRWVEEDYNKIIICNRCQLAVHQECYGASDVQDLTSWVCRTCETLDIEKECCLCTVKRGDLKPTDVESLWIHVTCAWFRPKVGFLNHEKMEPAVGILRIPSSSFLRSYVICKRTHGFWTQCYKCETYFHVMCVSKVRYSMELHCLKKNGIQMTKKLVYYVDDRSPNLDAVVIMHTPSRVFAARNVLQNENECLSGSRLISSNNLTPK